MTTYISLLRGINVSGHNLIKMEALRISYQNLGFYNVRTYVQSGNVIFSGNNQDEAFVKLQISQQIKKDFGFDVAVIIMSADSLEQIIVNNPFSGQSDKDRSFIHFTFLSVTPENFDLLTFESKKQNGEEVFLLNNTIYLYCPDGYGKTKLTNHFAEKKMKVTATTRNWKTTNELLTIAQKLI